MHNISTTYNHVDRRVYMGCCNGTCSSRCALAQACQGSVDALLLCTFIFGYTIFFITNLSTLSLKVYEKTAAFIEQHDWLLHQLTDKSETTKGWTLSANLLAHRWLYNNGNTVCTTSSSSSSSTTSSTTTTTSSSSSATSSSSSSSTNTDATNTEESRWPTSLFQRVGLEDLTAKLPATVLQVGDLASTTLNPDLARAVGLPTAISVYAGGADAFVGLLGVGVAAPGEFGLITGSSNCKCHHIFNRSRRRATCSTPTRACVDFSDTNFFNPQFMCRCASCRH